MPKITEEVIKLPVETWEAQFDHWIDSTNTLDDSVLAHAAFIAGAKSQHARIQALFFELRDRDPEIAATFTRLWDLETAFVERKPGSPTPTVQQKRSDSE